MNNEYNRENDCGGVHGASSDTEEWRKRIRITVRRWDERFLYGTDNEHPEAGWLKVCYADTSHSPFAGLYTQLYDGAQLNLLSVRMSGRETGSGASVLCPELLVLDPDFLIDITSICACIRPYGNSAYTYLLHKFTPPARSSAIQLGNAANQFLDDCIYEFGTPQEADEQAHYLHSLRKSFRSAPLTYSTLPDIDRRFFDECRQQYGHIRRAVHANFGTAAIDVQSTDVQLEPSFLCEALGIQGRMDLLASDGSQLVELKSGRADEYPSLHPRDEHRIQMALYKEILYYNKDRAHARVASYLFYSRYPRLYAIDVSRREMQSVLALRNAICHLERQLRCGESAALIGRLTEADFNLNGCTDRFYMNYLRPRIVRMLDTLRRPKGTEAAYFHRFLAFLEQEQYLAKAGGVQVPAASGCFADTWRCDTDTKRQNGNILTDLRLTPLTDDDGAVVGLQADIPCPGDDVLPNFRQGDMVMLYERNGEHDNVTNKQFFRCLVEDIRPRRLLLQLSYKQRNASVFRPESRYAVEPGYMDAGFNHAYAGLFGLLTAPEERKQLLLGERRPEVDTTVRLNGHYGSEETDSIVLRARQAQDYFLLVGPPGTGKTSVALRAMVEDFMQDTPQKTLLLMAYTNRAVDEICAMLSAIRPAPDYVRIGQELCCESRYRGRLLQNVIREADSRQCIVDKLAQVKIFTGTISSICGRMELFDLKPVDVAIIDEASQVLEPQLLPLLCATVPSADGRDRRCAIGKFILIGDHRQLPAVVMQPPESSRVDDAQLHRIGLTDCRNSLFERLHTQQRLQGTDGVVAMLRRQGRMHPALCDFVNRRFYDNRLDVVPLPHQLQELEWQRYPEDRWHTFVAQTRLGLFPVVPDPEQLNERSNRREADVVCRIVQTFESLLRLNGMEPDLPARIGIIVPFRAQIAMIRSALVRHGVTDAEGITIDTVERYQGSQRDVILFSTTVSSPAQLDMLSESSVAGEAPVDRKLNVALTRARKQFFLIGHRDLLLQSASYRELIGTMPAPCVFNA